MGEMRDFNVAEEGVLLFRQNGKLEVVGETNLSVTLRVTAPLKRGAKGLPFFLAPLSGELARSA